MNAKALVYILGISLLVGLMYLVYINTSSRSIRTKVEWVEGVGPKNVKTKIEWVEDIPRDGSPQDRDLLTENSN